jgi:hypothetical protein
MRHLTLVAVGLLVTCPSILVSADELKSGLQPGDTAAAFNVKDVTGPRKGKSLCYR